MSNGREKKLLDIINEYRRLLFLPPREPGGSFEELTRERNELINRLNTNPPPWLSRNESGGIGFQEFGPTPSNLTPTGDTMPWWWKGGLQTQLPQGGQEGGQAPTAEDAPKTGAPGYGIEQINGYDVQVFRDENGSIVEMNVIGPSLTSGVSGTTAEDFYNQQLRRGGLERLFQGRRGTDDSQRRQLEQQWASEQGRLLQIAQGSPRDWLRAWELGQQQNPFAKPQRSTLEQAKILEEDVKHIEPVAKAYKNLLKFEGEIGPEEGELPTGDERATMEALVGRYDRLKAQSIVRREEARVEYAANKRETSRYTDPETGEEHINYSVGEEDGRSRRTGPPTPAWLAGMFPNQLTTGKSLEKFSVPTPSAQWWNQSPESQKQAFLGLVDWTGGVPMDLLGNIQQQLPQPRRVATRRPARQRTSI